MNPKHNNAALYEKTVIEVHRAEEALESLRRANSWTAREIREREEEIKTKRLKLLKLAARVNLTLGNNG